MTHFKPRRSGGTTVSGLSSHECGCAPPAEQRWYVGLIFPHAQMLSPDISRVIGGGWLLSVRGCAWVHRRILAGSENNVRMGIH
jgi:hypothetical protein